MITILVDFWATIPGRDPEVIAVAQLIAEDATNEIEAIAKISTYAYEMVYKCWPEKVGKIFAKYGRKGIRFYAVKHEE